MESNDFNFFSLFKFLRQISCTSDCPQTFHIVEAGLELLILASTTWMLVLEVCTTTPRLCGAQGFNTHSAIRAASQTQCLHILLESGWNDLFISLREVIRYKQADGKSISWARGKVSVMIAVITWRLCKMSDTWEQLRE